MFFFRRRERVTLHEAAPNPEAALTIVKGPEAAVVLYGLTAALPALQLDASNKQTRDGLKSTFDINAPRVDNGWAVIDGGATLRRGGRSRRRGVSTFLFALNFSRATTNTVNGEPIGPLRVYAEGTRDANGDLIDASVSYHTYDPEGLMGDQPTPPLPRDVRQDINTAIVRQVTDTNVQLLRQEGLYPHQREA